MEIGATAQRDLAVADRLLALSYPALLKADYPPSILVTVLPLISRARPELVSSGRYYGAFEGGELRAAGGWSHANPSSRARRNGVAHVRHVVSHPRYLRRGYAGAILMQVFEAARSEGVARLSCQATRTAVPFYGALGFVVKGNVDVPIGAAGLRFPAVLMHRDI